METFDAIRTVLAVRSYQDKSLPPEAVLRIVQAGRLTGRTMNSQPWHFIVIEERDTLHQLDALARSGLYIAQAPLAIVVLVERSKFSPLDGSRVIQSMILAGWAKGIGTNWVGFLGFDHKLQANVAWSSASISSEVN